MSQLVIIYAHKDRTVVAEKLFEQLQPRIHHATPLIVAAKILGLFSDRLADPFLKLRLRQVVVENPPFVAGVVRRVDVNALDPACMSGKKRLESQQVVALDNQIAVETWLLTLGQNRQLGVELENVMGDRVVVRLNRGLSLELEPRVAVRRGKLNLPSICVH